MLEVEATMNFFVAVARHSSSIFRVPIMLVSTYAQGSSLAAHRPRRQVDHTFELMILEMIDN